MFLIRIRTLCFIIFLYSKASSECPKNDHDFEEQYDSSNYQNEIEEMLSAFEQNDIRKMEEILSLFKNKDIDQSTELDFYGQASNSLRFVPNRIVAEGYPVEDHEVITDDGYILHLYRLPHGKNIPESNNTRPSILIMHGILSSSHSWIALGADHSLAFLLADAGYDVWLANARGTQPSRTHIRLSATGFRQKEYWQFSWHEIGMYDLPAMIDYILSKTNQKQLNYVGYSQGTTAFLVMASQRPKYNDKILEAHLMAPVASLKDQNNNLFNKLAHFYKPLKKLADTLRIYKISGQSNFLTRTIDTICKKFDKMKPCKKLANSIQMNCTVLANKSMHLAGGSSLTQLFHYLQMIRDGGFNLFNYDDEKKNMRIYGENTPPAYNLSQITTSVNLYFSRDDDTATLKNAIYLRSQLINHKSSYLVPIKDFRHIDFTYSRYIRKALNDKLVKNINSSNGL